MEQMKDRLKKIVILSLVLIAALACRLAYIQLAGGEELSAAERSQSLISLEGGNTRGIIYDCSGVPLVADNKRYIYIIEKSGFDFQTAKLLKGMGAKQVMSGSRRYYVYSSEVYDADAGQKLYERYGAYIIYTSARYSSHQTAAHLIGYVNESDSSGASGLELMFDRQLDPVRRHMYAVADAGGSLLPGCGLMTSSESGEDSYVKDGIRTTIDKEMQEAVEKILEEQDEDCAAVVLDCRTGGIAAMACTPTFDPGNVSDYIDGGGSELVNKATQGEYPPGSVFKMIVAAAALESGMSMDKTYDCKGCADAGGHMIKCETGGDTGHGKLDMKEAFAESCNSYFVQLGKELGSEKIISAAEDFHLGETALEGYPQESPGHLMTSAERQGAAVGNLSIGQGETLVTPLQVARMTSVIANGGTDKGVKILMDGDDAQDQVVSGNTAEEIAEMMAETVRSGTAATLDMTDDSGEPETAVKTGTAQYGSAGSYGTHAWITGFTPCKDPEYTVTVLVEDGKSGSGTAGPVYRQILDYLKSSGSYSKPTLATIMDPA